MFSRNCPSCDSQITYKCKRSFNKSVKNKSECKSCCKNGDKNSFYGKKHSNESKVKMASDRSFMYTENYKKKMSKAMKGKKNSMYGKNIYQVWCQNHGKEEADRLMCQLKMKRKINSTGKNNPMYGKPAPIGSGNGWSGWYKEWYFRSLRELAYMIDVIERNNLIWRSGESKDLKIPYLDSNKEERNYYADFLINEKKLIEIKPYRLHNTPEVLSKTLAAQIFCKQNNLEYEITDVKLLPFEEIQKLFLQKAVTFIQKYDDKMKLLMSK